MIDKKLRPSLYAFVIACLYVGGNIHSAYAGSIDNEQINYGSACTGSINSVDWDTIAQCSGSVWQHSNFFLGTSSDTCDANHAGMMIYNSSPKTITYCNGTSWVNFGGNGLRPAYAGVTNAASLGNVTLNGFSCYVDTSHNAYCVGNQSVGQLGNGSSSGSYLSTPALVNGGLTWSKVSSTDQFSCGLTTTGAAYCWGYNANGNIGDGTTTYRTAPTAVSGGRTYSDIVAAGTDNFYYTTFSGLSTTADFACGISGGALYCWGDNTVGQLGTGNTTSSLTPVAATGGLSFTKLAKSTGSYSAHMCGIISTGAAYCWGDNNNGQLGNNSTTNSSSPVLVSGGLSWTMLATASVHTCGVANTGAAYCWGYGGNERLGNNSFTTFKVPTLVSGGLTWSTLAGGVAHTCGITTGGAAYCWGDNFRAELGLGPGSWLITYGVPTAVTVPTGVSSTGWTDISAAYYSTMGLNNGSVYGWGSNSNNEFGDPYFGQIVPVQSQ